MPPVTDLREDSFVLLIAYVVPGFRWIPQLSMFSEPLRGWLALDSIAAPTVAGFLYVTVASVGSGLTASTVRWLTLDALHHHTGIPPSAWMFRQLQANIDAFRAAVQYHYRYYHPTSNEWSGISRDNLTVSTSGWMRWRSRKLPARMGRVEERLGLAA